MNINKENKKENKQENLEEISFLKLKEIKSTLDLYFKKEKYDNVKIFRELYQRVKNYQEKK